MHVFSSDPPNKEGNTSAPLEPLTVHRVERYFCLNVWKSDRILLKRTVLCVHCTVLTQTSVLYFAYTAQSELKLAYCTMRTLYSLHSNLRTVLCVHCTVWTQTSVLYFAYTAQSELKLAYCTLCTLYSLHSNLRTLYNLHSNLRTVLCVHCTVWTQTCVLYFAYTDSLD